MHRRNFLAATLSPLISAGVPAWTAHAGGTSSFPGVQPQGVTIVFNPKDSAETVAAQELQTFLRRMTNVQTGIVSGESTASGGAGPVHFLVGRTPATQELIAQGRIEDHDVGKAFLEEYIALYRRERGPGSECDLR